ncbi:DUF1616 domain-containing protein [Natrinema sp. J7-2]|uniref:DUF1616 domain-containing protein n=1 Tax=Natrinema sp. (strain J7-2) TaxID=406552 RepID=UPI00026D4F6E|nr:DUF1616 domain-containing protein [Natrinema sp. J7-2]AFO56623.1 hypothetical protein NJ7G_1376 [Natrinema sp. J7-2]
MLERERSGPAQARRSVPLVVRPRTEQQPVVIGSAAITKNRKVVRSDENATRTVRAEIERRPAAGGSSMSHETSPWTRFDVVRRYPVDLAAVSIGAVVAYLLVTAMASESTLRLFVTVPLTLFLPGYALVSVLFPAGKRETRETAATAAERRPRGIDGTERMGLAFVLSLAVVPLIVLLLPLLGLALTTTSIAAALGFGTVAVAQIGVVRRLRVPDGDRFAVSPLAGLETIGGDGTTATASSILLVLAIGTAVSALLVAFLLPVTAGGFTELALYSEDEDGEVVAGELPNEIEPGESIPLTITIENQEGAERDYTAVVQEQTLEDGTVVDRTELRRIDASVSDGATGSGERTITPTAEAGETVRISVLLYEGEPPATPTNGNAAEETHFWVTVTEE